MMSSVPLVRLSRGEKLTVSHKTLILMFRWWDSTAWTTSPNRRITSSTWTVHLRQAGVTTTTRRTHTTCTTCTSTWPSSTTCAGTHTRHTMWSNRFRKASESPVRLCEQEAGLPHLCAATSLRGGGAYSSPGVWIHAFRKHLTRTAAQEGTRTLGRESKKLIH